LDGGLNSRIVPKAKRTLVFGTSGKGPAGIGYQVTQRSTAAKDFGLEGSLIHSIEEAATYCDNVVAYR
jgi:phage tail sheath gpL-like